MLGSAGFAKTDLTGGFDEAIEHAMEEGCRDSCVLLLICFGIHRSHVTPKQLGHFFLNFGAEAQVDSFNIVVQQILLGLGRVGTLSFVDVDNFAPSWLATLFDDSTSAILFFVLLAISSGR
jgi:hypothetical protein